MIHQLKCNTQYFKDAVNGHKTFEVRRNDRRFHLGDYLALNEISENGTFTGFSALFHVHYILDDPEYVKEGFVILGIEACSVDLIGISCEPTILEEGVYNAD